MAYAVNTSRKIPAGTQSAHTYGLQADGRDYGESHNGGLLGWLTHVASSTNVEFLDVYLRSGETLSIYTDYIAGTIPAQSGPRIVRPAGIPGEASWQGHDGTKNAGVGFNPSGSTGAIAGFETGSVSIRFYDLILYSKTGLRCIYGMSFAGVLAVVGCVLVRTGSTPTSAAQNAIGAYAPSGTLYLVNNIFSGFYEGFRGEVSSNSAFFNNTFVDMVSRGLYWGSGTGINHQAKCYNNAYYNCGATSIYPTGLSGTNVTLNNSTDLADYAGGDYHLSTTASEALGQGTNLSADAVFSFADDIDNTNVTTWNIGAGANLTASVTTLSLTTSWNVYGRLTLETAWTLLPDIPILSNFSDYFKEKIFKAVLGVEAYTPAAPFLALTNPSLVEAGFDRIQVSWGTPSEGEIGTSAVSRTSVSTGNYGDISRFLWKDADTNGNTLADGYLDEILSVVGSGYVVSFPAGSLKFVLGGNIFHAFSDLILEAITAGTALPVGAITVGLVTDTPNADGTFTEVSATGYVRATTTIAFLSTPKLYVNAGAVDFPEVLENHDWGSVTGYVMFIDDEPFAFGLMGTTVVDFATYGVTGYSMADSSIIIEVS